MINKLNVQTQLVEILHKTLKQLSEASEAFDDSFFEATAPKEALRKYITHVETLSDLVRTTQQLLDSIPDEVISNDYDSMTDEQLLRILAS